MRTVLRFLFPAKSCSAKASGILLASRMIFGGLLFSHGIAKWSNFDTMSTMFPDPLGIGSSASLSLAIFGEVISGIYRRCVLPAGIDPDDLYHVHCIFRYSRRRSVCGERAGTGLSGDFRLDVYCGSRKLFGGPFDR